MSACIGIIACSAEGASLCYRTICTQAPALLGTHAHPDIVLVSPSLASYVKCMERDDWEGVGELMLGAANTLAQAGAKFLICPDNTVHRALPGIAKHVPVPWLHIADAVLDDAEHRGFRKLGLMGTRWLVQSDVYPERMRARGLAYALPPADAREEMNRIIMDELVAGIFKDDSVAALRAIAEGFKAEGCDAVILGCTELPLALSDTNCPVRTLDSTRLLAHAALRRAVLTGGNADAALFLTMLEQDSGGYT